MIDHSADSLDFTLNSVFSFSLRKNKDRFNNSDWWKGIGTASENAMIREYDGHQEQKFVVGTFYSVSGCYNVF